MKPLVIHMTSVPETLAFLKGWPDCLREAGFEFHAVSTPGPALDQFARTHGIGFTAVPMVRAFSLFRDALSLIQLWLLFRRLAPVIVHAHTPKAGLLGMCAAWLARVPVRIFHVHGLPHLTATGLARRLLLWTTWLPCRLATAVLAVSTSNRNSLEADGLCPPGRTRVPARGSINGVDAEGRFNPARFSPAARAEYRRRYGIPDDAFAAAFVGRIATDKGLRELVHAWETVMRICPTAHLIVAGGRDQRDPVPPEIEARLLALPGVHHTGWIRETAELYAAIDLLLLPSYREGFSVVLLEASAMRLPVVATDVTGCRDAVVHGETGTLVPARDIAALAEAIRQYARDPALREAHGRAGRERVLAGFRPQDVRAAVLDDYRAALAAVDRRAGSSHRVRKSTVPTA